MADDSGPQSLIIVVLRHDYTAPWFCSILQFRSEEKFFNTNKAYCRPQKGLCALIKRSLPSSSSSGNPLLQKEYIAHFRLLQRPAGAGLDWNFCPMTSTQELCMVPYVISSDKQINHHLPSFHAFTFNFVTKTCRKISPCTIPSKPDRCVVSLGGYMYFMPQPNDFLYSHELYPFERYNPVGNSWETLKHFPLTRDDEDIESLRNICGTAVLDDTILFNMGDIWAYNVINNSWYPVTVKDSLCYSFVGEAVVQENTIYALKDKSFDSVVLALSIVREESNGGDPVYTCSLLSEISLPDMNLVSLSDVVDSSTHLVRLGKDKFCLVRSFELEGLSAYQPIQLTYMKLAGTNSLIVTDNKVHKLRIDDSKQFMVSFCFTMPDCKTPPAVKHGNNIFFDVDPFRVGFDINQIYQKHGKIFFDMETGRFVLPPLPTSPLVARDEEDVSSQTNMIDEQEFDMIHHPQPQVEEEEEDVPEKSSSSSVAGISALSKESTISCATHGDYPDFQTVGEEIEYYTRGMSRGEAFKARSKLLDRLRQQRCWEFSSTLAKRPPFPEA